MKSKWLPVFLSFMLLIVCSGCSAHFTPGGNITFNDSFHYSTYANARHYNAGDFTYHADEISEVRVYWVAGQICLTEKMDATLSVSEESDGLPEDAQLHYLIEDDVLTIHYCASDYRGTMKEESKQLSLEIPAGVSLIVESVSAPIEAESLTAPSLRIETVSGGVSIGQLVGEYADFSTVSGNMDIGLAGVTKLTFNSVSGKFDAENITVDQLTADTVSGNINIEFIACREAALDTISGRTDLIIPAGGGTVRFDTSSGDLITELAFQKQGDFYGFGPAETKISVSSVSGSLRIGQN